MTTQRFRFSPLNRFEYASALCSLLIIVFPFVDQYMFQLYSEGFVSYIILTIPLGIIPFILAWLGKAFAVVRSRVWRLSSRIF